MGYGVWSMGRPSPTGAKLGSDTCLFRLEFRLQVLLIQIEVKALGGKSVVWVWRADLEFGVWALDLGTWSLGPGDSQAPSSSGAGDSSRLEV